MGRCPIPAFLCLLLNNEVNNPDPSLAHFCPRSCSPTPQQGSTWGLPPLPLCQASQWDTTTTSRLRFLPTFITKDAFQWEIPLVLWKRGFIKSWLEISTEHRYKRKLFATICLGGTRAFATDPSLICTPKGNAYLTGHQNTGVVSSGFDTFIATVTVVQQHCATHIHTWGREPRNNLPILRHHITF